MTPAASVSLWAAPPSSSEGSKTAAGKQAPPSALDEELLKDLDEPPADGDRGQPAAVDADDKPEGASTGDSRNEARGSGEGGLDQELLRDLDIGGDEADETAEPLTRIGRKMRQVEERISKANSGRPTQELQDQIVHDLDELLAAARKRQGQPSAGSKSSQGSRRDRVAQPQQQSPGGRTAAQDSRRPARDSSPRQVERETHKPDMAQMNDLLRELWGHLPQRERQQVINSTIEKFVPKYELLIEEYFKRLADSARDQRR